MTDDDLAMLRAIIAASAPDTILMLPAHSLNGMLTELAESRAALRADRR